MLVFPVKQGRGGVILWSSCCITLSWTLVFPVKQDNSKGGGGGIFWPTCCILISCLLALPPKQSNGGGGGGHILTHLQHSYFLPTGVAHQARQRERLRPHYAGSGAWCARRCWSRWCLEHVWCAAWTGNGGIRMETHQGRAPSRGNCTMVRLRLTVYGVDVCTRSLAHFRPSCVVDFLQLDSLVVFDAHL